MNRSQARNFLCKKSSADAYAFLNSDAVPCDDWMREIRNDIRKGYNIVYGPEIVTSGYSTKRRNIIFFGRNINAPSCNLVYNADVFWQLGGFDESLNVAEDIDLNYRAAKTGYNIIFNPRACVFHQGRKTFWGFLKQSFWYGYGWAQFEFKHNIRLPKPKIRELSGLMLFRSVFSGFGYLYGKSRQGLGF